MNGDGSHAFPFGRPLKPTVPAVTGHRRVFVLGAYPSALHVHWRPPPSVGGKGITALPVDNEPTPFWDGADAAARVEEWKAAVGFEEALHGSAVPAIANGDSGRTLVERYLEPLDIDPDDCWITDCLDTYRLSPGGAKAIGRSFAPYASATGVTMPDLPVHPQDGAIKREAVTEHRDRLMAELIEARPDRIITLGNAAYWVLGELLPALSGPSRLFAEQYGRPLRADIHGRSVEVLPLAHPGAINRSRKWQRAHDGWAALQRLALSRRGRLYLRPAVSGRSGDWPEGTPVYRVDAALFPDHPMPGVVEFDDDPEAFAEDLFGRDVQLVVSRTYHDRPLLGVLLGGRELLSRSYPRHRRLSCVAITDSREPNIDWVYERNGVELVVGGR